MKLCYCFNSPVKSLRVWKRVMSVACKYLTPLKPTPNSKVFRNLHCKFKRLNSFSVSVNGHSENAYLRSLWALSGHSLQIERMTGLAQNLNLRRRSTGRGLRNKGRGLRNTILKQLNRASNVGAEIYWGIHFHSCTNLELNRDANFVGSYFTIIS